MCETEWTSVTIYQTMLNIVSLISGRIIIGSPENRKDSWVKFAGNYTRDTFKGGMLLRSYPVLFRPLAARFIPEVKRCTFHKETAIKIVKPIFEERMLELDKKNLPNDGLQWIINSTAPENRNAEYLSHEVRMFVFASVFTTTQNSVELIHSLIAHPEYIQPLREEAARVLGEGEGIFTRQGIRKMELMDSFMNETIRHGSANACKHTPSPPHT